MKTLIFSLLLVFFSSSSSTASTKQSPEQALEKALVEAGLLGPEAEYATKRSEFTKSLLAGDEKARAALTPIFNVMKDSLGESVNAKSRTGMIQAQVGHLDKSIKACETLERENAKSDRESNAKAKFAASLRFIIKEMEKMKVDLRK